MKKQIKIGIALLALALCTLISLKSLDNNKGVAETSPAGEKVLICHKPPGNSANGQDIWVSSSAVPAHLAHGDFVGSCETALSCQELCEQQYNSCVANAAGHPNLLKICESQRKSCLSQCGPADPGETK